MLFENTKMRVFSLTKKLIQLQFFTLRFCAWWMWVNMMLFLFSWEASLLLFLSASAGICRRAAAGPPRTSWPWWGPRSLGAQLGSNHVFLIKQAASACWRQLAERTMQCVCAGDAFLCSSEEEANAAFVFQPFTRLTICCQQKHWTKWTKFPQRYFIWTFQEVKNKPKVSLWFSQRQTTQTFYWVRAALLQRILLN